jgi:cytochrome c biogenesis protein
MTVITATRIRAALALLRNTWRGLTSMRTALILLFLLALAALPGALLPQYSLNAAAVRRYQAAHPTIAPPLERLGFFDVFAAPWFAAIYLLLFVSLVGCLVPRSLDYVRSLRARPVATPRNLGRLPHHARSASDAEPAEVIAAARGHLRGWRLAEAVEPGGAHTLSAEKGYLREAGNLVFHFALLALLVTFAAGKLYGYEGQVIVLANGGQFCNSGLLAYDSFKPGVRVDGTQLDPFCVRVDGFAAEYEPNGQARAFRADVAYQDAAALDGAGVGGGDGSTTWRPATLRVNHPLRLGGDRVYLIGHGYAPRFTVTFPGGQQRTGTVQWRTVDNVTLLSEGATKFDPPGVTDPQQRRQQQLAITGLFAPTAFLDGKILSSSFPEPRDPAVAVDVLRGDLGTEAGRGQSIFDVDPSMLESGRLVRVARQNLRLGEQLSLDDGTVVRFDGVEQWVSLQVSYDPAQLWVLVSALLVLGGLAVSLSVKRRRFWVRATPGADATAQRRTVVEVGGLARTDQAGYGEECTRLAALLLPGRALGAAEQPRRAALAHSAQRGKDNP